MNSGKAVSSQLQAASHIVVASSDPTVVEDVKNASANQPTIRSEIETQTPEARIKSSRQITMTAGKTGTSMSCRPQSEAAGDGGRWSTGPVSLSSDLMFAS